MQCLTDNMASEAAYCFLGVKLSNLRFWDSLACITSTSLLSLGCESVPQPPLTELCEKMSRC